MPAAALKQKIKKDLSQEKWKQDAKKNFGRSQSVLEQNKETTGESVQFPGLDGEALSFVDTNDFLLSSLFLLNDYDKGKRKEEKNGLFQFRKLGQENQPGIFRRLLSLTISKQLKGSSTHMSGAEVRFHHSVIVTTSFNNLIVFSLLCIQSKNLVYIIDRKVEKPNHAIQGTKQRA